MLFPYYIGVLEGLKGLGVATGNFAFVCNFGLAKSPGKDLMICVVLIYLMTKFHSVKTQYKIAQPCQDFSNSEGSGKLMQNIAAVSPHCALSL